MKPIAALVLTTAATLALTVAGGCFIPPPGSGGQSAPAPASAGPAKAEAPATSVPEKPAGPARSLVVSLESPLKLGGFELWLAFDAKRLAVDEPVASGALQGYICASNREVAGELRYTCAGLPAAPIAGEIATVVVHGLQGAVPRIEDFAVTRHVVVDDTGAELAGVRLALALAETR